MKYKTDPQHREKGTQLLELAIVLPVLCLIFFIVAEGADFVRVHVVLNNAAREGARLASQPENQNWWPGNATVACPGPLVTAAITGYITAETSGNSAKINPGSVTCTLSATQIPNGATVMHGSTVTLTYPYTFRWLPSFGTTAPTVTIQTQATFRNLF